MVAHQHPGVEDPATGLHSLLQGLDKAPTIMIVRDNVAAAVAAGHRVIYRPRILDSTLPRAYLKHQ